MHARGFHRGHFVFLAAILKLTAINSVDFHVVATACRVVMGFNAISA